MRSTLHNYTRRPHAIICESIDKGRAARLPSPRQTAAATQISKLNPAAHTRPASARAKNSMQLVNPQKHAAERQYRIRISMQTHTHKICQLETNKREKKHSPLCVLLCLCCAGKSVVCTAGDECGASRASERRAGADRWWRGCCCHYVNIGSGCQLPLFIRYNSLPPTLLNESCACLNAGGTWLVFTPHWGSMQTPAWAAPPAVALAPALSPLPIHTGFEFGSTFCMCVFFCLLLDSGTLNWKISISLLATLCIVWNLFVINTKKI
jgi:hypothetical protein